MLTNPTSVRALLASLGLAAATATGCSDGTAVTPYPSDASAGSDGVAPGDAQVQDGNQADVALCCACGNAACCDPGCPQGNH